MWVFLCELTINHMEYRSHVGEKYVATSTAGIGLEFQHVWGDSQETDATFCLTFQCHQLTGGQPAANRHDRHALLTKR